MAPRPARSTALALRLAGLLAGALAAGCAGAAARGPWPAEPAQPEFPFSFAVVGNTSLDGRDGAVARRILAAVASERPVFVLHAGNVIGGGPPGDAWEAFDEFAAPLREAGAALFPAPGPSDLVALDAARHREWSRRFPWASGRTWREVRCRNVLAILLDTNFSALGRFRTDQEEWLERRLAWASKEAGIRFVFAVLPRGPVSNGPSAPDLGLKRLAERIEACPKALVVFSGVEGAYQRIRHAGRWWVTSGGGGGPATEVFPDPERRRFLDSFEGGGRRPFHFLRVRV
ncbi:MAG: hypothetical protein MUC63_04025, partial [Planctomycetes bacterium]|nr:hypothetical protein [Planctomycetota bacterium]